MKKTIIACGLMFALTGALRCGDDTTQFWQSFSFDWRPIKGLKLELEKQLRYVDTFADVDSDITQIGVSYKVRKWLAVQADYRFTGMGDEKRHRLDGNLVLSWDWPTIGVSNRARLQHESVETLKNSHSELVFRDRLRVTFLRDRNLQPFVGGEIFLGINEAGKSENKYRLTAGVDYLLSKRVTLSLFGHRQKDTGEKTNETAYIIAGGFNYSF